MNDDAQLVTATLGGDKSAFGELVERYQERLYTALVRYLGSPEDAYDVTQDAFVQAYTKLSSFRGASAFYTWLYRIAFNLAMSHARRRRNMQSLDQAKTEFAGEPMDHAEKPDDCAWKNERASLVHAAIAQLDEEFRQVIVLREIEGFAYDQIAEVLTLPVGTVRSRLFRARMQLRQRLAPILEEEQQPSH